MTPFQQGGSHKILETCSLVTYYIAIIKKIDFRRFQNGPRTGFDIRPHWKKHIHPFQNRQPVLQRFMGNLQILGNIRKYDRTADPLPEHISKEPERLDIPDLLGIANILSEYPVKSFPSPPARLSFITVYKWFGKSTNTHESPEGRLFVYVGWKFIKRKGMKPPVVIPAKERISTPSIYVQSGGAGHQDRMILPHNIINSLDPLLPPRIFVKFVKHQKTIFVLPAFF